MFAVIDEDNYNYKRAKLSTTKTALSKFVIILTICKTLLQLA